MYVLRNSVRVRISTVRAGIAFRAPQPRPTRSHVHMPAKLGWIDKCSGEKQAATIGSRPVSVQAPRYRGKRKGREVRETPWCAKNEKTGSVGNQVQAGELEFLLPIDPSRGRHLKALECQPTRPIHLSRHSKTYRRLRPAKRLKPR